MYLLQKDESEFDDESFFFYAQDYVIDEFRFNLLLEQVVSYINSLSGNYKTMGYLYFLQEWTITEIANYLNLRTSTICYIRDKIRKELKKILKTTE